MKSKILFPKERGWDFFATWDARREGTHRRQKNPIKRMVINLIFLIIITSLGDVHAQEHKLVQPALQVSPIILNIELSPGKNYEYKVKVKNLLSVPLPLRVSLDNLEPSDDETNKPGEQSPILFWTYFDPKDMIIPAGETKEIKVAIQIPNKIPLGGYYETLFLEPVLPTRKDVQSVVQAKVGVIILANIGVQDNKAEKGKIVNFSLDKFIYENGPIKANFKVKNTSLYHFSAKPFLKMTHLFGRQHNFEIGEKVILPGKTRSWKNDFNLENYKQGFYKATLIVSTGGGDQITNTSYFIAFPISKIILLLIIVTFVLVLIVRRKRVKKALLILLGNK